MKLKSEKSLFSSFVPIAEAISKLLNPHAEVILHDLESRKIVGIFNNFSKRKVGDESFLEVNFAPARDVDVIGPYPKINWDGRKLKSITSVLRDGKGKPFGLMCINLDVSEFDLFQKVIQSFLHLGENKVQPQSLFKDDWREKINSFIDQYLRSKNRVLSGMTKGEQAELVQLLQNQGAFEGKNAATYIGQILGVSRATVYNYLKN